MVHVLQHGLDNRLAIRKGLQELGSDRQFDLGAPLSVRRASQMRSARSSAQCLRARVWARSSVRVYMSACTCVCCHELAYECKDVVVARMRIGVRVCVCVCVCGCCLLHERVHVCVCVCVCAHGCVVCV